MVNKQKLSVVVALWLCLFCESVLANFDAFKVALDDKQTEKAKLLLVQETEPTVSDWSATEQGRFFHQKGLVLEINDQIEAAKQAFTQSIDVFAQSGEPSGYWVKSLLDRSYMDYLLTNDPKVYCVDRVTAVELARKLDQADALVGSLVQLAFCYQDSIEDFKTGLAVLDEAATVSQDNQLAGTMTAMIHNATANLYRSKNIHDKAYEYYQKAYQAWAMESGTEDIQDMFNMQHNMVKESVRQGRWQQAEQHVANLFKLAEENPDFRDFTFFAFYNQAYVNYSKNEFVAAIESIEMALELADTTPETYFVKILKGMRVVAYFRQGERAMAGRYVVAASKEIGTIESLQYLQKQLAVINAHQQGDLDLAVDLLWELLDAADQTRQDFVNNSVALQSVTFDQKISQFQQQALADQLTIKQLELEKQTKQNQINQLELDQQIKENRSNQLVLFLISLLLLGLLLAFWLVYRSRHKYLDLSRTDPLTKIANRRHIIQQGQQAFKRCQDGQQAFYLAIIDIDDFKQINDQYGHVMGDEVIKAVVKVLQQAIGPGPMLGRIGGEEFVLMWPNCAANQFAAMLEQARKQVAAQAITLGQDTLSMTISVGYVGSNRQTDRLESLMSQADDALYRAKAAGKNQVIQANPR